MASPSEKKTKAQVNYQWMPQGNQKCGNCAMFIKYTACTAVEGMISQSGWCVIWKPK